MIAWDKWRTLLIASQYGSYSKAAQVLGIDATTIGRRLKNLESELGFQLHFRSDGRLYPTRQCEVLLRHLETADEALRDAAQHTAPSVGSTAWRELRMTAPPFLLKSVFAPDVHSLTARRNIRIEMFSTSRNSALTRREADISVRIEDHEKDFKVDYEKIEAVRLGALNYAVFAADGVDPETLPWSGLFQDHQGSTGSKVMTSLAGQEGFRYQTQHFDTLAEIVASGVAKALLPVVVAQDRLHLNQISEIALSQPLWMFYHQQDEDVPHLVTARNWIANLIQTSPHFSV